MSGVRPQSAAGAPEAPDSRLHLNFTSPRGSGKAGSTPRPATAGLSSARSTGSLRSPRPATASEDKGPHRDALAYFDTFKKEELRELIAESTASWLLSADFRGQASLPCGLVSNLSLSQEPHLTLLIPKEPGTPNLEYRELHQIVRDLTSGIFGGNQMPSLSLEPNFDLSTTCQMPQVYKDTRVGQVLLAVDYAMKSLWHGAHVPKKQREKLTERWRALLDVNSVTGECNTAKKPISDFITAGQEYITADPNLKEVYQKLNSVDPSLRAAERENLFFSNYSDYVRCVMYMFVSTVRSSPTENVIALESSYDVAPAVTLPDHDHISPVAQQRLRRRLRHHISMIREGLLLNPATRKNVALLQIITSLSLVLVALRRRLMRIPNIDALLNKLPGDLMRTETELPPFAIGPSGAHPCETFTVERTGQRKRLSHTHGEIQFDVDTDEIEAITDNDWCREVQLAAKEHLSDLLKHPRQEYPVPTTVLDDKDYYVIHIPLTTFYPASPPQPAWLHARYQLLSTLRPRKLPMNDLQLAELFKRVFGFRQALANKSLDASSKLSCCRGLVAPFITLVKKTPSSTLFSPDLQGMTLLHYACTYNRKAILSVLLALNPILNVRRTEISSRSTRATPLHFAARCGALECVTALLASRVITVMSDGCGHSAIHHACAADQIAIARCILRRHPNLLELRATGGDNATPLLVAASNGSLQTLKFLIGRGASVTARDVNDDGPIQRAALNFHASTIEYFVQLSDGESSVADADTLQVWEKLVDMLRSPHVLRQDAALRCLEVLLHRKPAHWRPLMDAGAVNPLVCLLRSNRRRPNSATSSVDSGLGREADNDLSPPIRSLACSVVCLMSEQDVVRKEIADAGAIPTLIKLLKPLSHGGTISNTRKESLDEQFEIQSRSSVVLTDLAHVDDNAARIAEHGGIRPLVELLQIDVVDVLVNAINTLAALCRGDRSGVGDIQRRVLECGAAGFLVDFLAVRDDALQTSTADAIAAACDENEANQNEFVKLGVLTPLVAILRGHCIPAQMSAAVAVDALTRFNHDAQMEAVLEGAPDGLCRLFQIWSDEVKERGACALWSLAGTHPEQQRKIAQRIGTVQINEMLLSKSDTLQWIGCQAVAAWSRKSLSGQNKLADERIIAPLVRLLRLEQVSRRVLFATIDAISTICIGVAHVNNKRTQLIVAEEGAIELLTNRVWRTSRDETMQVDLLYCLACAVTGCPENEERLNELGGFGFDILLEIINSPDVAVKVQACASLALFAFNRIPQQQKISRLGALTLATFDVLFECKDKTVQAGAAFQLVVLARVVFDTSIVDASAKGIITLVNFLDDEDIDIVILAANYLASLAHTRAGVPDAIVTSGAVRKLLYYLESENDLLRQAAAQALGYLTFNRTASRELMSACRGREGVYESLLENLGEDGRLSEEFIAEFKRQSIIGLPIPKGPSAHRPTRPQTAASHRSNKKRVNGKSSKSLRARSISPVGRPALQ